MAIEKYGFFDSTESDVREYTEADWVRFANLATRDGVRSAEDLTVTPGAMGLTVQIGFGLAMVGGHQYELYDDGGTLKTLSLNAPSASARVDRIVLRLDNGNNTISLCVKQGAEGADASSLTRTESIYEVSLAKVRVGVGATSVDEEDITDERGDTAVCGIIHSRTTRELEALVQAAEETLAAQTAGVIYRISEQTMTIGTAGWAQNASGLYEKTVSVTGLTTDGRMRWSVNGNAIGVVLIAGVRCDANGAATLVSMNAPSADFSMTFCVEGVRS